MNIVIDKEFQSLIPALNAEERTQLEANIVADGCRDPLVLWGDILIDGHNRYEICTRLGIEFSVVMMTFNSRDAAMDWMDANQLGRRNITPDEFALILGRRYNRQKKAHGAEAGGRGNQYVVKDQIDTLPTADRLAAQHGVSSATVKRAGQYADAVAIVEKAAPGETQDVPRQAVIQAAAIIETSPEKAHEILKAHVHVAQNSGNNEWYTPSKFVDLARTVMGGIDTDPATSEVANKTVQAALIFTADNDGREQEWRGRVWMNPPYAQPLMSDFAEAVSRKYESGEIEQACILVNNATETQWFQRMLAVSTAVCFPKSRIKFLDPQGNPGAPLQGQAIIYMGDSVEAFREAFDAEGVVLVR